MKHLRHLLLSLVLCAGLPAATTAETPATKPDVKKDAPARLLDDVPPERPKAGGIIDDAALESYLRVEAPKLLKGHHIMKRWSNRLGLKRCALDRPAATTDRLPLSDVVRRVEAGTLVFATLYRDAESDSVQMDTATAFVLSASGAIVTARHVVDFSEGDRKLCHTLGMLAMTRDGRLLVVTDLLASDPLNDIVVLQTDATDLIPLALAETAPAGAAIGVLAHSDSRYYTLTTGVVSRLWKSHTEDGIIPFLAITADFAAGASGGPVFDETGAVVGVVNSTESVYFDETDGKQTDLQMVIKNTTPARVIIDLTSAPAPAPESVAR